MNDAASGKGQMGNRGPGQTLCLKRLQPDFEGPGPRKEKERKRPKRGFKGSQGGGREN